MVERLVSLRIVKRGVVLLDKLLLLHDAPWCLVHHRLGLNDLCLGWVPILQMDV